MFELLFGIINLVIHAAHCSIKSNSSAAFNNFNAFLNFETNKG